MSRRALIIDDEEVTIEWLRDWLELHGFDVEVRKSYRTGRAALEDVAGGRAEYDFCIMDIMIRLDDDAPAPVAAKRHLEDSVVAGLDLCRYATRELLLVPDRLPIIACSVRDDAEVHDALRELGIDLIVKGDTDAMKERFREKLGIAG